MIKDLIELLKKEEYKKYFAHISTKKPETLFEHTTLVKEYFERLVIVHKLNRVIDSLINEVIKNYESKEDGQNAKKLIKEYFFKIPDFHDIGKLNPNFQRIKMNNDKFERIKIGLGSNHSKIGAFLYIQHFLKKANGKNYKGNSKKLNLFLLFVFSFSILQHHAPKMEYRGEYLFDENFFNDISKFIREDIFLILPYNQQSNIRKQFNDKVIGDIDKLLSGDSFPLFALLKLNYSLLTTADYLATTHYMNNWQNISDDFGVIDDTLKEKVIKKIETSTEYNREIYRDLNNYQFEFPTGKNLKNLNKLRKNLAIEIIKGIRENINENLFYIEAPTGSGKTNLSILALAEFLKNDFKGDINKVFYVFPFTTLITQTFNTLKETLGLDNNEIVQIHSKAGFSQKENDDKYGKERINIIDYQFANYPFVLVSHIKFFDILKSNGKTVNYILHRLANSVVIIDELQAYSPKEWDKVIYFINNYAKHFNIKFILMSATLPKIDKLLSEEGKNLNFDKQEFIKLTKNKDKYFQNPNFSKRVEFDFSMLNNKDFYKNDTEDNLNNVWDKLIDESEKYKRNSKDNKVHTIIEFIFKKTADKFMKIAEEKNSFFDEILLLSGTILEPRRKEIISKLKSDKYKNKSVLLITTQVVEAGLDIDMDLGFKDTSIIDSDEQLAGRINRNVKKRNNKLFLFNYDDEKIIYSKDYRYRIIKEELKPEEYHNILQEKNFDKLYDFVMKYIAKFNEQEAYSDNLPNYLKEMKRLNFNSINDDFKLIKTGFETLTLFIPIKIPIKIPDSDNENFSFSEIEFLKDKSKYFGEYFVDGERIWELYCEIIENEYDNFTEEKRDRIIIQGLVSKFSFSISAHSEELEQLIHSGDCELKYGFYKVNNPEKYYDFATGFKVLEFEDIYFW